MGIIAAVIAVILWQLWHFLFPFLKIIAATILAHVSGFIIWKTTFRAYFFPNTTIAAVSCRFYR